MNTTVRIALKLITDSLQMQPVFLCVDDTMVSKFGTKFENVSKLFDHAAHNGSNYLNGHCFVSVMLCVPVWNGDKVSYLSIPLGYRMWQKKKSKLELAASMIRQVMPEFHSKDHVIILCDSWYTKQNLVSIVDEYPNLDLICSARIDSVMYDLAPARTGDRSSGTSCQTWKTSVCSRSCNSRYKYTILTDTLCSFLHLFIINHTERMIFEIVRFG